MTDKRADLVRLGVGHGDVFEIKSAQTGTETAKTEAVELVAALNKFGAARCADRKCASKFQLASSGLLGGKNLPHVIAVPGTADLTLTFWSSADGVILYSWSDDEYVYENAFTLRRTASERRKLAFAGDDPGLVLIDDMWSAIAYGKIRKANGHDDRSWLEKSIVGGAAAIGGVVATVVVGAATAAGAVATTLRGGGIE